MKSIKIKLHNLSYEQQVMLNTLSNEHRILYNHLLRIVKSGCSDFKLLNEAYKEFRKERCLTIQSKSAQNTCNSLINNIKSYYSLRKKDPTAKFPHRFKSSKYFTSFTLDYNNGRGGFKLVDNIMQINLNKLCNKLKLNLGSAIKKFNIKNKDIKIIALSKDRDDYYIIIVYSEPKNTETYNNSNFISLDLGITSIYTAFSNKIENYSLSNKRFDKIEKQIEHVQSIKDKKKKHSKKWKKINKRVSKLYRKLSNKNIDFQHKSSRNLINTCKNNNIGTIICGDIQVKSIIKKENKALKSTSKNFGLSRFKTFLEYKAKDANIDFHKVDEAYTTQTNCLTDEKEFSSDLSNRFVKLNENIIISRDLNSAINISKKIMDPYLVHLLIQDKQKLELNKMYMNNDSKLFVYD